MCFHFSHPHEKGFDHEVSIIELLQELEDVIQIEKNLLDIEAMLQEQEHYFVPATNCRLPFQKQNQKECHQVLRRPFL